MNIALVATYTYPIALGLRYISSCLKAGGHDVRMFFMRSRRDTAAPDFSPALLSELVERLRSADLIGLSVMTNTFNRACVLTSSIRKAGIKTPIIWGGPHPTTAVEESLELADMVGIGEGERVMLQLVDAMQHGADPAQVHGLALKRNGTTVRNRVALLTDDLDEYPFPDYDPAAHWVAMGDHFEIASPENLRGALHRYRIETTRGCPYSCTFCNNAAMKRLYKGSGMWVRKRSNENVIREIEEVRARFPTIEAVNVIDDLFFIRSEPEIADFARLYEARVNLPLELDAHPNTITEGKIRSLARLPIALISMGIQSGSPQTLKQAYQRPTTIRRIVEGINILADNKIRAEYHYLVNNPFDSDDNRIETLRFAATYHRGPAVLRIFPLQLYPGTPLYDRARAEGVIKDRHDTAYEYTYTGNTHLLGSGYLDIWLRVVLNLRNIGVPRAAVHRLIDVVTHSTVRRMIDHSWFPRLAYVAYNIGRFVGRKLLYQPLVRPLRYLSGRRVPKGAAKRGQTDQALVKERPRGPITPNNQVDAATSV